MSKKQKVVSIPLVQLQVTFFVRRELNENHVIYLAELYENGVELPPLDVAAGTFDIIDGRHRKAALELLNKTEAPCVLIEVENRLEMMANGFKANVGGALPPTRWDIVSMMRQLIENGATQKRLVEIFSDVYPPSLCRRYIKDAFSEISKTKLQKAVNAVVNEAMTVPKAAEKFGVDVERLKNEIQGKKKKRKGVHVAEIKNALSQRYKGNTFKTYALLRGLVESYEDGGLAEKQIVEVFDHVEHLLKRGFHSYEDWRRRFEMLAGSTKSEATSPARVAKPNNSGAKATLHRMGLA